MHTTCLVVDCIKEKDSGSYKVMAINTEGSAESTASLLVSLREEQSANYLGFAKRSAQAHESADAMAEEKKERKFRVDLRCVGSPFDKMSKVHKARSRSKNALVRAVYFRSGTLSNEKEVVKECKHLETASERAPSPPPMFDRSERFNDRFSDIYCDRRTGGRFSDRFSDKFSDRCSDRYSERFSDTESLHNEVRTKLTTLQKAVKQRKRLSISTMSSSEFDLESVTSEPSSADHVEKVRGKPAYLSDVQHFNRPLDLGDGNKEIQSKTPTRDSSQTHLRHSFEPQSRTRAIRLMKGELVDTKVPHTQRKPEGETSDKKFERLVESEADAEFMVSPSQVLEFKVMSSELHHDVSVQKIMATTVEVEIPHSETCSTRTSYTEGTESMPAQKSPKLVTSSKAVTSYEAETGKLFEEHEGISLRAQYEKALDAEHMECEEKLLALRITKWQQGSRMSEEMFHPETDLPLPAEPPYMEPEGYTQQEEMGRRKSGVTEAGPLHKSSKKNQLANKAPIGPSSTSPKVKAKQEETEFELSALQQKKSPIVLSSGGEVLPESPSRAKARAETRIRDSPRLRPGKTFQDPFASEAVKSHEIATERRDVYEEEHAGESLRAHYEKELETERMECEEKLLALRIRKWQQGMILSEEDTFHPETDLPMPAGAPYMEPEGQINTQQEVQEKGLMEATEPCPFHKSPRMKTRADIVDNEASVKPAQKSPGVKARIPEKKIEASPRARARQEKTKEYHELQLSRENIYELKTESEQFVSEEEALTQRIMEWQQGVFLVQQEDVKLESEWVEGFTPHDTETTAETGRGSMSEAQVVRSKKTVGGSVPVHKQGVESPEWLSSELPIEGRETRLQKDSQYLVSEQEAMAQRILKWQQEEVTELESEWPLDNQGKQLFEVTETIQAVTLPETFPDQISNIHMEKTHIPTVAGAPLSTLSTAYGQELQHKESVQATLSDQPSVTVASTTESESFKAGLSTESAYSEALPTQKHSPTPQVGSLPSEEQKLASAQRETLHKLYRQQVTAKREAEEPQTLKEYATFVDKSGRERFQSEVKEEDRIKEEIEKSRVVGERRLQRDLASERKEIGGELKADETAVEVDTKIKVSLKKSVQLVDSKTINEKPTRKAGSSPVCIKELSSVNVKIGEMSEFCCQFQGEPVPVVTWLKDGQSLAYNPDYNIVIKSNYSKLTVFYPTSDHEGTYECVLTNKYGKCISSAILEISDKKVIRALDDKQEVIISQDGEKTMDNQERPIEAEVTSYTDTGKYTLQVPQVVMHKQRHSYDSLTSSPVEIRITAATPVPEMTEEVSEDSSQAEETTTTDVPIDDSTSQIKHKFTFSFDVVAEAPNVVRELENITCPEGNTAVLECVISGKPAPEVTWYYDDACLNLTVEKYITEVMDKVYRLYIKDFTYSDAGVYKCVAKSNLGEVTSISDVSFQAAEPLQYSEEGLIQDDQRVSKSTTTLSEDNVGYVEKTVITHNKDSIIHLEDKTLSSQNQQQATQKAPKSRPVLSRDPHVLSGCGLTSSAAVIKVSQIKQAFESESSGGIITLPSPDEQRKQTLFPEEFIPAVVDPFDQQKQVTLPQSGPVCEEADDILREEKEKIYFVETVPLPLASSFGDDDEIYTKSFEGGASSEIHGPQQFVEEVQDTPELIRPQPQKPVALTELIESREVEMKEETVHTFDRTSSFIPFQSEKVHSPKVSVKTSTLGEAVQTKRTPDPTKPEHQKLSASLTHSKAIDEEMEAPTESLGKLEEAETYLKDNTYEELDDGLISVPEPSMDSGIFLSLPESQVDVTEAIEVVGHEVKPHKKPQPCTKRIEEDVNVFIAEPNTEFKAEAKNSVQDKLESLRHTVKLKGESIIQGSSVLASSLEAQRADASLQNRGDLDVTQSAEARVAALTTVGSMEEEEVTFGAVYDYYNPPTDWVRPLSPESEMSIEIGSTVSEEIPEVAERFFTPESSTEASQPMAESFQTPKSPMSFVTPFSDSPGGFMTPQEYPFSQVERKRPSTGSSSEKFFSPLQFLPSPAEEGLETSPPEITVDETRFLASQSSVGLGSLQEKVQGIPPAFLKPLIKKRVFENDTLKFYAEVFGLPSPDVKWFCNKSQLVEGDRIQMERDGDSISLTIDNVTKADQGEYICEAVNYVGEARSVALVIVVSQEVRFMPAPPAVTHQHVMEFDVEEDDDASRSPSPQEILLEVELDEKDVKEFEKQVKIITIPEYTADNKSMIISLDVLPSIYEEGAVDFVTQEHGDLKIAFEVTEMPPRFINPICDMEAHEGTTIMFECSLMGIPSPVVSWFKSDKKIPHNNKKFILLSDGDNHFLKICKITSQDSGVYTCRAINVVGETLCRASLVVLSAKAFAGKTRGRELTAVSLGSAKVQPQKFDLMVGNTSFDGDQVSEIELEFEFEQEADESQRAVRLVANTDNETSEQGEKYVSINFDVFAEPAKDDKIEFKGKSSEMCSFHFQVTETAPKCVIPLTNVTAAVGTPVILQCLVSGKPNPTAEWYKDGECVTDSKCIIQEKTAGHFNLLITNVTQSDAGEYKCLIQNSAGCIETTALLKVF